MREIVVVGAAAGGLAAVQALRAEGFRGDITVVGSEEWLPYDRPPLSKGFITEGLEFERIRLGDDELVSSLAAEWRVPGRACALDLSSRTVRLDDGRTLGYDGLIVATGVSPRRLSGATPRGVHRLRTIDDALRLREALRRGPKVAVVGCGVLGMEFAASMRKLWLDVTVIGNAAHPLERQFPAQIGQLLAERHEQEGVTLMLRTQVGGFVEHGGELRGVALADGEVVEADLAVVAIGSVPNTQWLEGSGLELGDGIVCDAFCRAGPQVYAAGDVASWWHPGYGRRLRLEHRMNATEQATVAARNLLGQAEMFRPVPFLWTDQYDVKLQSYGMFPPDGEIEIEGDPSPSGRFVAYCRSQNRLVGALGWNAARALRQARAQLVEALDGVDIGETKSAAE